MNRKKTCRPNTLTYIYLIFLVLLAASVAGQNDRGWKNESDKMVREQLIRRGISDTAVLRVMDSTPRHCFVPAKFRAQAYADGPQRIAHDQTISQPYIVALMTELLKLTGTERVLEIGTGSGYQAAILSQMADSVYSIEIVKQLANSARTRLDSLGYENVIVKHGDGYQGWPEHAPFDRIIVTAAPPTIPIELIEQLKPNGRMVLPVGTTSQRLKLITKLNGEVVTKTVTGVRFVPMVHPKTFEER